MIAAPRKIDLRGVLADEFGWSETILDTEALPPWLDFYPKVEDLESEAAEIRGGIKLEAGIGIQLAKKLRIVSLHPDGAASRSGQIEPGDELQAVDGQDVVGLTTKEAAQLIRGPEGTAVELELRRAGDVVSASVVRAALPQERDSLRAGGPDDDLPSYATLSSPPSDAYWGFGFSLTDELAVCAVEEGRRVAVGDVLISVDGVRVTGVPAKHVHDLLAGQYASESDLLFVRKRGRAEVFLVRMPRTTPAGTPRQEQGTEVAGKGGESASEPASKSLKKKIGGLFSGWGLFK